MLDRREEILKTLRATPVVLQVLVSGSMTGNSDADRHLVSGPSSRLSDI
jgi:hypothetical protein